MYNELQHIRTIAIISLFSDNDLMEKFVLKGGSALNIAYGLKDRASIDIDVSMSGDFDVEFLSDVKNRLEQSLVRTFNDYNYYVFDVNLTPKPLRLSDNLKDFWGGYCLTFKIIEPSKYKSLSGNLDAMRRDAIVVGDNNKRTFKVDISKYEYCAAKEEKEVEGYTVYVYTPLAVVYEKLRAICQQMDEYIKIVPTNRKARARDFFDIYNIMEKWITPIQFSDPNNLKTLEEIFAIKKVPLKFLGDIENEREFHRDDFNSLKQIVDAGTDLKDYDYYFDYVVEKTKALQSLWEI